MIATGSPGGWTEEGRTVKRWKLSDLFLPAVWMALVAWRPFVLGFYHDDWSTIADFARHGAPFSAARFNAVLAVFAPRPIYALFMVIVSSLLTANPFMWQCVCALLTLAVAHAIRRFVDVFTPTYKTPGLIAGVCWLALPTALGSTVWPTTSGSLLAVFTFLVSARILLRSQAFEPGKYWPALVLYAISILTYETFYFQFLSVIALVWFSRESRISRKQLLQCVVCFGSIQTVALLWNRVAAHYLPSVSKSFAANWYLIFVGSFVRLPHQLFLAFREVAYPLAAVITLLVAIWCLSPLKHSFFAPVIAVFAAIMCTGVYAMAGYGLSSTGVFSRTFLGVGTWFCVGFGAILGARRSATTLRSELALSAIFIVLCSIATIYRTMDWARSWQLQREIIASAPVGAFSHLPSGALVLADVPAEVGGVTVFEAYWDITGALGGEIPFTVKREHEWISTWNGTTLRQSWNDGTVLWDLAAKQLWVWRWPENTLTRISSYGSVR
ncbi:MAG TPA: hypothetical protein VGK48_17660 [Terriglobia bacterium]|jgi:hypothetical protein